ncbi:MAG: hypothetical protein ACR2GL_05180 [Thermoleophilaceae bacterium]
MVAALALAAMAVTAVLVLRDSSDQSATPTTESPPRQQGVRFGAARLGIVGFRPRSWRVTRSPRAIRVRSPDRAGLVGVSVAPSSVGPRALIGSSLAAVRRSYRRVRLAPVRRARIGGVAARTTGGTATNSSGVRLDLVLVSAKGSRRTYLIQAFVARSAAGTRLAEAQQIVNSLDLTG